jgi:hypothetical protein
MTSRNFYSGYNNYLQESQRRAELQLVPSLRVHLPADRDTADTTAATHDRDIKQHQFSVSLDSSLLRQHHALRLDVAKLVELTDTTIR